MTGQTTIAIIGAGLAGLRLSQRLSQVATVTVIDKSRGLGGRMSTRRAGIFEFDHGAQFFTARTQAFRLFLEPFLQDGTVAKWEPRVAKAEENDAVAWGSPRYVAVPGMNALAKAMARNEMVTRATRVTDITRAGESWVLPTDDGEILGPFDWVVSTAPAEQSASLIPTAAEFSDSLGNVQMHGCYCLMVGYVEPQPLNWEVALPAQGPLAWIALNHSRPGRSKAFSLVAHSRNDWADAHLEADQEVVKAKLCEALEIATELALVKADHIGLHRWRYAKVAKPAPDPFLADPSCGLAVAGDWCGAGRVETAFESADALADFMIKAVEAM